MEKTFSSMSSLMLGQIGPRNSEVSPGFCALVKGIRRAASAVEQDEIIEKEMDLLRQKLAQPDVGQVCHGLITVYFIIGSNTKSFTF
ncbi:hypothetical protein HOLleu_20509 [Holothuria leucospilota]|uniref:Uncharacterized protein n=1 Tax=Holothuria leucospilota TaxID=206669 RepID=A0A9Q1H8I5_HOLLE|nr:hypothetical protein HOLleu_20509 [Holothuria leucospilota]